MGLMQPVRYFPLLSMHDKVVYVVVPEHLTTSLFFSRFVYSFSVFDI
jgi:hypothetical protein